MKIPIPQTSTEQIDIFSFGFSPTLNRSLDGISTGPVYNPIKDSTSPAQVYPGTSLPVSSLRTGNAGSLELLQSNNRFSYYNATKNNLTNSAGNDIFRVEIKTVSGISNDFSGGTIEWTATAEDGANYHCRTGITTWTAVNKAGTFTTNITEIGGGVVVSLAGGTFTGTWSIATGTNFFNLIFTPTSSLTTTSVNLFCRINSINFKNILLL